MALIAAVAAGGGLVATNFIVSPAEAAARTTPPPARPITVMVVKQALSSMITTRGDVSSADSTSISVAAGSGAPGVVTGRVPKVGNEVREGTVLLEVSGRPVIALLGTVPGYRSLSPGSSGQDVVQLQKALARLGFNSGPADGKYDPELAAAVARLYRSVGYSPPTADVEAAGALKAARGQQAAAQQALSSAEAGLRAAEKGATDSQRLAAAGAVQSAADALEKATTTGTPPDQSAVEAAARSVQSAMTAFDQAQQRQAEIRSRKPQVAVDIRAAEQAAAQAADRLAQAQAAAAKAARTGPPDQAAIRAAENQLEVTHAQQQELLAGPDSSDARRAVTAARQQLTATNASVRTAESAAATPLPLSEVTFLASLPRRVDKVAVQAGSTVMAAVMSLSSNGLQILATVTEVEARMLKPGMRAALTVPGTGTAGASISKVAASTTQADNSWQVWLTPDKLTAQQEAALRETNIKVDIKIGATAGAVLTVPIGGLFSDAAGNPRVEVLETNGTKRFQRVRVGLAAQGKVEIHPVADDGKDLAENVRSLQPGTLVVVGQ
ncbi:peptidoglycan hydrolase-like protein with peptidoglycan-binding domain [Nakamurella sp. UYEF19]|uniref:peptidoglycan-binding domain-containing protein n=1 Tax=Nakamurella sp. UYEF19 TaxID=1756392 RepID=UPI0033981451